MTTPKAYERDRRDGKLVRPRATAASVFARHLRTVAEELAPTVDVVHWPSPRWRDDPVGFGRDVLGVTLRPHQCRILEAAREHPKVAIRSGQKAGKTTTLCVLALWFYCSFVDARVIMTATTAPQVDRVLWRELKKLKRRARRPIDGEPGELARTGLKSPDFREVLGYTAREVEAVAGVSGANLLYEVDEASSLSQDLYEAFDGNTAGDGEGSMTRMVFSSNPTRDEGPFFDAFHKQKAFWFLLHINCEDVAAEMERDGASVPGMVTAQKIARWKQEYGEDSVFYRVRVRGEFVLNEQGKAISFQLITEAQQRYDDTPEDGPLRLGIDPAGPGDGGDETAFALVRGQKLIALFAFAGLSEDAIIQHALALLRTHRTIEETPEVIVDSEGPIGGALFGRLRAIARGARPERTFVVHGVRASLPATREPTVYERTKDELIANLARWLREGGAIPPDHKLEVELHAGEWIGTISGKLKITPKDEIKERLKRSPDRRDALALAVWQPSRIPGSDQGPDEPTPQGDPFFQNAPELDAHKANDIWWPQDLAA